MRDVNHGEIARAVERCEFGAQAAGGVAVERAEGLIKEQDTGFGDERAAHGDVLAFSAAERVREAVQEMIDAQQAGGGGDASATQLASDVLVAQTKGEIAFDVQVRKQQVVLTNHSDAALSGGSL